MSQGSRPGGRRWLCVRSRGLGRHRHPPCDRTEQRNGGYEKEHPLPSPACLKQRSRYQGASHRPEAHHRRVHAHRSARPSGLGSRDDGYEHIPHGDSDADQGDPGEQRPHLPCGAKQRPEKYSDHRQQHRPRGPAMPGQCGGDESEHRETEQRQGGGQAGGSRAQCKLCGDRPQRRGQHRQRGPHEDGRNADADEGMLAALTW